MMRSEKNSFPEHIHSIHLIAICGTGMGALACMLKDLGFLITGSDQKIYPPMSTFLIGRGIKISDGFDPGHIAYRPDLVIVGNAVKKDNPEVVQTNEMGLNYCSMPQALNHFFAADKKSIIVAGTHGKTTTSSLIAWILCKAGLDPSFMIGGILKNFDSNYRMGKGNYIVIEGDEYDTAFFDKGPKFLHYHPFMAVLTSIEFDHADIFKDLHHVKQAFDAFIAGIPHQNALYVFDRDPNIADLILNKRCRIMAYGQDAHSYWQLGDMLIQPPWSSFSVLKEGKPFGRFTSRLMGIHNLLNALSAIAVADGLSIPVSDIQQGLETFQSVKRRQEIRGVKNGITIMDDFAHHPTAVRETIRAVKPFYPSGRLIAVFEPRTNTSMRNIFQNTYPYSFEDADLICVRKPPLLEKIPAGERFSSEQLVEDLTKQGKDAYYFPDTENIIDFLKKTALTGDIILIMSNGGFENIHERLFDSL